MNVSLIERIAGLDDEAYALSVYANRQAAYEPALAMMANKSAAERYRKIDAEYAGINGMFYAMPDFVQAEFQATEPRRAVRARHARLSAQA